MQRYMLGKMLRFGVYPRHMGSVHMEEWPARRNPGLKGENVTPHPMFMGYDMTRFVCVKSKM